jgi:hypothetical protein
VGRARRHRGLRPRRFTGVGGDLILLREGENGLLRTVTPWARGSGGAVGSERGFPAGVVLLTPICFLCKKNVSVSRIAKNFVKLISG